MLPGTPLSSAVVIDPYAPSPGFLQRHARPLAATSVGLLTAFLTVVAFPPYQVPEAAYALLVPGIYWAYTRPPWRLFVTTLFVAQALAWTILLGWLHNVTWLGLFLLGPFVGAWVGSWFLAARWLLPRMVGRTVPVRLVAMIGLAGCWVVIEWTRSWLLGGFPWLPLAASQWERTSILQIAAYTGAYGISFVLVMVNLGFGAYAHRLFREGVTGINKRSQEFFLALFLLLACVSVHFQESFNRRGYSVPWLKIGLVQPAIAQEVKWDPARAPAILETLTQTTLEAASRRPDLLVWPEAVTPMAVRGDASAQAFVESLIKRSQVPLVLGSIAIEQPRTADEAWYNGAFVVTPEEGVGARYYAKRRLVPFGEFVPLRPLLGWIGKFVPIGGDFMAGETSAPLLVVLRGQPTVVGPLICYEDTYPQLARFSALSGASALVVLTNNGWFGEGGAAYQHAAHAVLRAVETRRPVLRCGNAGWSGWIDEFGVVRSVVTNAQGSIYFRGSRVVEVTRDVRWVDRPSFYVEYGDWFVAACAVLAVFGVLLLRSSEGQSVGNPAEPSETSQKLN
ncbi:MAG: apolipoprotein N-acyltransferase [Verrucomicrobia bacterium]|nr:apolipoprotein N-acyltransferase [Verrucomicrobiota bacterium]